MTHQKAEGRLTHTSDTAGAVERAHFAAIRQCVTWLHGRANEMNDPHARAILNSAALDLGRDKPAPEALSLIATLQGRVDLAVGALEVLAKDEGAGHVWSPHRERWVDPRDLARDTLSKIKEGDPGS